MNQQSKYNSGARDMSDKSGRCTCMLAKCRGHDLLVCKPWGWHTGVEIAVLPCEWAGIYERERGWKVQLQSCEDEDAEQPEGGEDDEENHYSLECARE